MVGKETTKKGQIMHFTTLYLLKNEELDNVSVDSVSEDFFYRFCYGCGENVPKYQYWCDWFQIGGRWCDLFKAKRGLVGERSWCNTDEKHTKNTYSIVEIKDLKEEIDENWIYAIATRSRIYHEGSDKYKDLLQKINSKQIKGVVALVDCHD